MFTKCLHSTYATTYKEAGDEAKVVCIHHTPQEKSPPPAEIMKRTLLKNLTDYLPQRVDIEEFYCRAKEGS